MLELCLVPSRQLQVYALNMSSGERVWEWDANAAASQAAAAAGLPAPGPNDKPLQVDVISVTLDTPDTLYVTTAMPVPASDGGMSSGDEAAEAGDSQPSASTDFQRRHGRKHREGDDDADDGDGDIIGWVWALNLKTGTLMWGAGPVQHGVAQVVAAERQLLVSSKPDADGTGTLLGVNKVCGCTCLGTHVHCLRSAACNPLPVFETAEAQQRE